MSAVSINPKAQCHGLVAAVPLGRTHTRQVASVYIWDGPSQWLLCGCWQNMGQDTHNTSPRHAVRTSETQCHTVPRIS